MRELLRPRVMAPLAVTALAGAAAVAAVVLGATAAVATTLAAVAVGAFGVTAAAASHQVSPGEPDEEEREQKGPGLRRRHLMLGAGAGAAAVVATAVAIPASRRLGDATERLQTTAWRPGSRLVDPDNTLIRAADIADGEMLTVYPEGATDAISAQAVLIRESTERFVDDPERADWVAEGIVVYSKLCTHMACPLGLYQQQSGTLLCPCHQAVFDVLDGGRAIQGPARRALPQLPVEIDAEGHLVARGGFSDAVGTGFWGRP